MPGTVVRDALAPNLVSGATLTSAGTTNGTPYEIGWVGDVQFELVPATVSGTSPTLDITIQAADDSAFTTNVVTIGRFSQANNTNVKQLNAYVGKRYVRAVVVVGGTTPSFAGTTLTPVPKHDRRVRNTTTA